MTIAPERHYANDTDEQDQVDAAWRAEFRRRIDEIESGKVQLVDVSESRKRLRARLAPRPVA